MIAHFLAPREPICTVLPGHVFRCVTDVMRQEIDEAGGAITYVHRPGRDSLVRVRAPRVVMQRLKRHCPVRSVTQLEQAVRASYRGAGHDLARNVRTYAQHDRLLRIVEQCLASLQRAAYVRLAGLSWPDAAQVLTMLGGMGYGLNRISTGTFPTTSVLDSGVRATENPLSNGGKWTNPAQSGNQNLQLNAGGTAIVSTQGTSDTDGNAYWSNATFGPDCEVGWTMTTRPNRFTYGYLGLIDSPGTATMDGYFFLINMETTTNNFIATVDNGSVNSIASWTKTHSDGDKVGFERIGAQLTVYRYTAGAWSSSGTTSNSAYTTAGNIGMGDKASATAGVYNDFFGGTVTSGPGTGADTLLLPASDAVQPISVTLNIAESG